MNLFRKENRAVGWIQEGFIGFDYIPWKSNLQCDHKECVDATHKESLTWDLDGALLSPPCVTGGRHTTGELGTEAARARNSRTLMIAWPAVREPVIL